MEGKALVSVTILVSAVCLMDEHAIASGFYIKEQSPTAQGNAFAGAVSGAEDASYLFFNSAAIAYQSGTQINANLSYILPSAKFSGGSAALGSLTITGPGAAGQGSVEAGKNALVPSFYISQQLDSDFAVGLGVSAPFGLVTEYESNWIGRYHGIRSDLKTYNANPVVSWKPLDGLALAAGIQVNYVDAELSSAINPAALGSTGQDGLSTVSGNDFGYGYTLGLIAEPFRGTKLGLSYRSQITHRVKGKAVIQNLQGGLAGQNGTFNAHSTVTLPGVYAAGITQQITSDWDVMGEFNLTEWRKFRQLVFHIAHPTPGLQRSVTDEFWKNSITLSAGTTYRWNEDLTLRAGISYDESPVPTKYRTPRIPDADRYWASLGLDYQATDWLKLGGSYTHIFVPEARLALDGQGDDAARGTLSGVYKAQIDIISVTAGVSF